ncbi:MAG: hypothetical protein NT020_06605 [Chloroflexales bacterium]|nr:hypothetical protein [Chloroflexales bacterium]
MVTKLPVIAALTAQDILVASEPTWLQQWRQAAWQHVNESATPLWRRTDLTAYAFADMEFTANASASQLGSAIPAGVVVMPLSQAVQEHGELVKAHLGSAVASNASKYAALNAATWRDGWFVYVPKNHEATLPLHLVLGFGAANTIVARNLIVLERGAQLSLIEQFAGDGGPFAVVASELILGDGATLKYVSM